MSFTTDIQQYAAKSLTNANAVKQKVGLDLLSEVVVRSPVDTGRFRGNNQVGLGSANLSTDSAVDPSGNSVLQNGSAVIARAKLADDIVISNNLPYAKALENGHSQQAPAGVYGVSVAKFQAIFATAVVSVKGGGGND
jgi:hypothetical protein